MGEMEKRRRPPVPGVSPGPARAKAGGDPNELLARTSGSTGSDEKTRSALARQTCQTGYFGFFGARIFWVKPS
jgi:hypothetical protein